MTEVLDSYSETEFGTIIDFLARTAGVLIEQTRPAQDPMPLRVFMIARGGPCISLWPPAVPSGPWVPPASSGGGGALPETTWMGHRCRSCDIDGPSLSFPTGRRVGRQAIRIRKLLYEVAILNRVTTLSSVSAPKIGSGTGIPPEDIESLYGPLASIAGGGDCPRGYSVTYGAGTAASRSAACSGAEIRNRPDAGKLCPGLARDAVLGSGQYSAMPLTRGGTS
jgi:hypothetical protein